MKAMPASSGQWKSSVDQGIHPFFTVAIASGKGGTGKTTVSTAIAKSLSRDTCSRVILMDCDVEEPNCHLFIMSRRNCGADDKVLTISEDKVCVPVPVVDETKCDGCGACARFCRFNAIINLNSRILIFPELCHNCGGCAAICHRGAISEIKRSVGTVTHAKATNNNRLPIDFIQGCTIIGETRTIPVIKAVKNQATLIEVLRLKSANPPIAGATHCSHREDTEQKLEAGRGDIIAIIDCPPGTSCPMLNAVADVDHVILVAEPTPFGLNDLDIAVKAMRSIQVPMSVIINRSQSEDVDDTSMCVVEDYCYKEQIPVILKIMESMEIAQALSRGECILSVYPELGPVLDRLIYNISRGDVEQPQVLTIGGIK